jgi:hypothetical protein
VIANCLKFVTNEVSFNIFIKLVTDYLSWRMLQLGGRSLDGSFTIVAPFAGSPAEEVRDPPLSLQVLDFV